MFILKKKMKSNHKNLIKKLISNYSFQENRTYPLSADSFSDDDLIEGIKIILSKRLTMSKVTKKFEEEFAKFIGSKYALMVNSGSSANLLAMFALVNPLSRYKIKKGDECLIPALCWSTSLWPIVQAGLKPKFVDVDPKNLNISIKDLKKKISKKTKILMNVHILGNCSEMREISKICKKNNITIVEDTCESLGSKYKKNFLGTFGDFGTFSFYYSHQITSGEGGMIVCNDTKNYKILHSLRSHGWDRGISGSNNSFNFINSGFNLRPTDVSAAIGISQFKRLNKFKKIRSQNRKKIIQTLKRSKNWKNQFEFINPIKHLDPSWFGLPILINKKFLKNKKNFLKYLNKNGIENRPIISGNFLNQPAIKVYKLNPNNEKFLGAQEIEDRGFFIGLHINPIKNKELKKLEKYLLNL